MLPVENDLIRFYREDTGEKLLIPDELAQSLQHEQDRAEQAESQVKQLKAKLQELGVNPDDVLNQ